MFSFNTLGNLVISWFIEHGLIICGIIFVAFVLQKIIGGIIERFIRRIIRAGNYSKEAEEKRENTLIQVMNGASIIAIWITALLMMLSEAGVAIGPLLAAAGIAGIAVGFGGQYLIRDLISGIFIIIENQYRTGDVVCFGDTCGTVESVTLRLTTLRDLDGTVHHMPHGEIKQVANLSKHFARVNINIGVDYDAKLSKVIEVINAVGKELSEDSEWSENIISAPQFLRVEDFADSSVIIKILGDTKPLQQWAVAGELRKRLKIAFDENGIEIPFPQRVVHMTK